MMYKNQTLPDVPSRYEWLITPKYSEKEWVTSASIQTASASVSMFASTVMLISIIRHHKEELKTSPYFRLILSLAFADMIYSFSFIIGPFVVPTSYKLMVCGQLEMTHLVQSLQQSIHLDLFCPY